MSVRHLLRLSLLLALAAPCLAHDGPPYPILVDEPFGDRTLSVWADPDVGTGTFYLYIPEEEDAPTDTPAISAWVMPSDERLPEVRCQAVLANSWQPYQRVIKADFDDRGFWRVRFTLDSAETPAELSSEVEVTPPGLGRIDLLWFLSPFLLVGFLWAKAVLQRRAYEATTE